MSETPPDGMLRTWPTDRARGTSRRARRRPEPGHTPAHSADSEILMFSPAEELAVTEAVLVRNFEAMMAAPGA
jgi:hypothetical protein